jgi:hypothetical protein
MAMLTGGETMPIAQMGPDFVLLVKPAGFVRPAGFIVRLSLSVDGVETSFNVSLPHGLTSDDRRVAIAEAE